MLIYITLLIVILILCNNGVRKGKEKTILWITVSLLFVFIAFMENYTPDYNNYLELFDRYHGNQFVDSSFSIEIGFQWLCMVLPSHRMVIVVFALFYCICLYLSLFYFIPDNKWQTAYLLLFTIVPFLMGNISGIRSGFVTCFFLIAILFRNNKSYIRGVALAVATIMVGTLFHKSALLLIPLLFMPTRPFKKGTVNFIYSIGIILVLFTLLFPNQLNKWISELLEVFFGESTYEHYLASDVVVRFSVFSIMRLAAVFYMLNIVMTDVNDEKKPLNNLFSKFTVVYLLLCIMPPIPMLDRYQYYFAFPVIISMSNIFTKLPQQKKTVFILCLVVFIGHQLRMFITTSYFVQFYLHYDSILF